MKPVAKMNVSTGAARQPRQRRSRPSEARIAVAVFATAALVLLAAACGSGPSSTGAGGLPDSGGSASAGASASAGGSASSPSDIAYSHCMRSHGVPRYPDPGSRGLPKTSAQQLGVSDSVLQAAQQACQHLLPTAGSLQQQAQDCFQGGDCPPSLVQRIETAQRKFAECMRSHGVPNWPDPSLDSEGRPIFNLVPVGITHSQTHSPPISTKIAECNRLDPAPVAMASN